MSTDHILAQPVICAGCGQPIKYIAWKDGDKWWCKPPMELPPIVLLR